MSFITFDYICTKCGTPHNDRIVKRDEQDKQFCEKCNYMLKKLPAGPITTFRFGDRAAIKSKKAVSLRDKHG